MTVSEFYKRFSSDCWAGSANQVLTRYETPKEVTGRCWYRIAQGGENFAFLFSNTIDSTFSDGSISVANDEGGVWEIRSMRVGLCEKQTDGSYSEPAEFFPVTFDGKNSYTVFSPDPFCSDPVPLCAKAGGSLCYEITLFGACYPYHQEIVLPVMAKENGAWVPSKQVPVPLMIGCDRAVSLRVGFIGDSITQGCGTEVDSYTHWAAKIAEGLPSSYSVWDLGIGYARGYDAATDRGWLARAKMCDVVNVCFGVNDLLRGRTAEQVISDLDTIVSALHKAGKRVILFTVPPFDMTGTVKDHWYAVNDAVRGEVGRHADAVFDFADVLGQPAPNRHLSVYGGHPNAEGCRVAAAAYLKRKLL